MHHCSTDATPALSHGNKFSPFISIIAYLHSLAISQYIEFNIWLRVFHYLCGTSLSLLSKSTSIYMCPQSLLYNNKSQIHQPPCQVSSMGNRAFTCYAPKLWNSLNRQLLSKSSELYNSLFEFHFLKFAFNIWSAIDTCCRLDCYKNISNKKKVFWFFSPIVKRTEIFSASLLALYFSHSFPFPFYY